MGRLGMPYFISNYDIIFRECKGVHFSSDIIQCVFECAKNRTRYFSTCTDTNCGVKIHKFIYNIIHILLKSIRLWFICLSVCFITLVKSVPSLWKFSLWHSPGMESKFLKNSIVPLTDPPGSPLHSNFQIYY